MLKIKKRSYNTLMHYSQGFKLMFKFAVICICVQALNVNMLTSLLWNILLFGKGVFPPSFVIHQYVIFSFNGRHTLVYSNTWYWL